MLLRSWLLPNGEPVILGNVDLEKLGSPRAIFEPDGRTLLYVKDRDVYARALPVGTAADRRFDRLGAPILRDDADVDCVVLGDDAGEFRMWHYGRGDAPELRVVHSPGPPGTRMFPDSSGRWMVGDVFQDREIRLWYPAAGADARPLDSASERILVCLSRCRPPLGRLDCRLHVEIDTPDLLASLAALHADPRGLFDRPTAACVQS